MKTVIGIMESRSTADNLVETIQSTGLPDADITLLMPRESVDLGDVTDAAANSRGIAAHSSSVTGGAIGMVAGLGALAIPGFVPLVLAGASVTVLAAFLARGSVGILGELLGSAVPKSHITQYKRRLHDGGYLVAARADSEEMVTRLNGVFITGGAEDIVISSDLPA